MVKQIRGTENDKPKREVTTLGTFSEKKLDVLPSPPPSVIGDFCTRHGSYYILWMLDHNPIQRVSIKVHQSNEIYEKYMP